MSHLQRVSWILGTILIGASAVLAFNRESAAKADRMKTRPPVDKLAADLNRAWAGYHTP